MPCDLCHGTHITIINKEEDKRIKDDKRYLYEASDEYHTVVLRHRRTHKDPFHVRAIRWDAKMHYLETKGKMVSRIASGRSCKLYPPSNPNSTAEPNVDLIASAIVL